MTTPTNSFVFLSRVTNPRSQPHVSWMLPTHTDEWVQDAHNRKAIRWHFNNRQANASSCACRHDNARKCPWCQFLRIYRLLWKCHHAFEECWKEILCALCDVSKSTRHTHSIRVACMFHSENRFVMLPSIETQKIKDLPPPNLLTGGQKRACMNFHRDPLNSLALSLVEKTRLER